MYIEEQKSPILYQRVRDSKGSKKVELNYYKRLQEPWGVDEALLKKILLWLSCRRYGECSEMIPEAFGLGSSMASRRFMRASARKLKELMERRLDNYDIVVIIIDGKSFRDDEIIIALGVTAEGKKVKFGFIQAGTENASMCRDFLVGLLERGLRIEEEVLCVMDGSRGIRKAVEEVFGGYMPIQRGYMPIQRCQWHKRENVVSYLPKGRQAPFRKLLQRAYGGPTYERAKEAIRRAKRELSLMHKSAVRSLDEGFEETLTLQ